MDSVEPTQDEGTLRLRDLVQKHRVCWEVWSILLSSAQRLQVGCELVLYGTHANEQEPDRAVPDCPRRAEVYHRLRQIGEWLLPPPGRESRYDIQIFDRSLGYSPQRGGRPGVQLNIRMLQRNHSDRPVDNWEIHCLNEMRAKLESLGAPKGRGGSIESHVPRHELKEEETKHAFQEESGRGSFGNGTQPRWPASGPGETGLGDGKERDHQH